jgi:serine/threonine-protein kinase
LRQAKAVLVANGLGRVRRFTLRETRSRGVYSARTVLPAAGRWTLSVRLGKRALRLGAVAVGPRRPDVRGPFGLAVGPDGHIAIADRDADRVVIVNPRTGASRVAATGLDDPIAVAYDSGGALYANSGERVVRIGLGGTTVVAGTGRTGPLRRRRSGDGGRPRGHRRLCRRPGERALPPEYDNWIRCVRADGIIETIAGTGTEGFAGDGGPARAAAIAAPHALAVRSDGSVVFADSHNGRVRQIDPSGMITTLASSFIAPVSIAAAPDGSVVVGDAQTGLLQRVEPNGTVSLIASRVRVPSGIAIDLHGDIYFSELDAGRVRVYDLETNRITTVAR